MSPHEFLATLASAIETSHQWATSKAGPDFWLAKVHALRENNTTSAGSERDTVRALCGAEAGGLPQMDLDCWEMCSKRRHSAECATG
jgi:hypothetical protein